MDFDDDRFDPFARHLLAERPQTPWGLPTPYDPALRALGDLRVAVDRLEASLVDGARRAGATWAEIGRELGVSRQAAHRRHARHDPQTARRGDADEAD